MDNRYFDDDTLLLVDTSANSDIRAHIEPFLRATHTGIAVVSTEGQILARIGWQDLFVDDGQISRLLSATANRMTAYMSSAEDWVFMNEDRDALSDECYPVYHVISSKLPMKDTIVGIIRAHEEEIIWCLVNAHPEVSQEGAVTHVVVTFSDITAYKARQEAIDKYKQRYLSAFQSVSMGMAILSLDGKYIDVNKSLCSITGYTQEELFQRTIQDITHPDDVLVDIDMVAKLLSGKLESYQIRKRCIHKSGRVIHACISLSLVKDPAGQAQYFVSQLDDITESLLAAEAIKESEDKFRAVSEHSHNGIMMIDMQGKIIWINEMILTIGEYPAEEVLRAESFAQFIAPESLELVTGNFYRYLAGEPYLHDYNFWIVRSSGAKRLCETHMTDYRSPAGKPILVISMLDITERFEAEAEKEMLQRELQQAQKMESVGRLAGGVAHDFNNMLSIILGNTELIGQKVDADSPLLEELHEIKQAAEHSVELTRQLLAFARKQTATRKVINLNDALDVALKMLRRLIGEDITLKWEPSPDLWSIYMDPSQINQILANLCVNARDAIHGVGNVVISVANVPHDSTVTLGIPGMLPVDHVMLTIVDDGCGMDEQTLDRLYEPFFTTKEMGKGTGLGLATIYGIVKQNMGSITVRSQLGIGTVFCIYLPRHIAADHQPTTKSVKVKNLHGIETILVVEDDPAILRLSRRMLEQYGYRVLTASNPIEAIALAEQHTEDIHLLLTDVVMPEMNGHELSKQIHEIYPDIKIVYMSGYTADVIASHGIVRDDVEFLEKPFSIHDMAVKIRAVIAAK